MEEKDKLLEMTANACPLQWEQCDCRDEFESTLLHGMVYSDFSLPWCESAGSEGDCTLADEVMALVDCSGVLEDHTGPRSDPCYDEFGNMISCDSIGPVPEPSGTEGRRLQAEELDDCTPVHRCKCGDNGNGQLQFDFDFEIG